jgi:hypothetical protein
VCFDRIDYLGGPIFALAVAQPPAIVPARRKDEPLGSILNRRVKIEPLDSFYGFVRCLLCIPVKTGNLAGVCYGLANDFIVEIYILELKLQTVFEYLSISMEGWLFSEALHTGSGNN